MPPPPADALLATEGLKEQIPALAVLYDRFAHAFDPFSAECDGAEKIFMREVAELYDLIEQPPKPSFEEFRKAVIWRWRRHLAATDRPSSI